MGAIHLRSAVCLLGRFPALSGVDLDVPEGEVVLLSGPNGAGKSTLLRLVAGLVPLTRGSATVLGHDLSEDRRSHRHLVGFLGHETHCYDDLSARENLRFHVRAAGGSPTAADEWLERLDLTGTAAVPHRLLSAGQKRRLALAVVLGREPELLLLDEPHAGLDAAGRDVLEEVIGSFPGTVLLASHELDRARALTHREVALAGGRVVGADKPQAVPASR